MIPVTRKPEPADFDSKVRSPGLRWLHDNGIGLSQPLPDAEALPPYWRRTQGELWDAYAGICAYLCIFFEWPLGAHSTDHFVAKSRVAGQVYEGSNYRLSCLGMDRNKHRFDDILDPFEIQPETFTLNLTSGMITANPALDPAAKARAQATIRRLKLDAPETNRMRAEHFSYYCRGDVTVAYLRRHSPFVWVEAQRQGLL